MTEATRRKIVDENFKIEDRVDADAYMADVLGRTATEEDDK